MEVHREAQGSNQVACRPLPKANTGPPVSPYKLYWYGTSGDALVETNASGGNPNKYVFIGGKQITVDWKALDDGVARYQAAGYKTDAGVEAAAEAGHEGIHLTRPIHMSEQNRWAIADSVEREAYGVQSSVSEAGGSGSVVWNNSWAKSADRETLRQNAVREAARGSVEAARPVNEKGEKP